MNQQQCAICLEPLYTLEIFDSLQRHFLQFIVTFGLSLNTEAGTLVSIQRYISEASFNVLLSDLILKVSVAEAKEIVRDWKENCDTLLNPTVLGCGHTFHARCVQQLSQGSRDQWSDLTITPLPLLPSFKVAAIIHCPICRTATHCQNPNTYHCKDELLGPYKLYKNSWVFVYDDGYQPGHYQAGSLGIIVDYANLPNEKQSNESKKEKTDPTIVNDTFTTREKNDLGINKETQDKDYVTVILEPTKESKILHVSRVFDLMFLETLGIPHRDEMPAIPNLYSLCLDLFSLPDVMSSAEALKDYKYVFYLKERFQYVNAVFENAEQLKRQIQKYFLTGFTSSLIKTRTITNMDYFWRYKILPRMGYLGLFNKSLLPLLATEPKWNTIATIANSLRLANVTVQHSLRYIISGYLCNPSVAFQILQFLQKYPAVLTVLPLKDFCISWIQIPQFQTVSEHEIMRLTEFCQDLYILQINSKFYYVSRLLDHLFTVSVMDQLSLLKESRVTTIELPFITSKHLTFKHSNVYTINPRYLYKLLPIPKIAIQIHQLVDSVNNYNTLCNSSDPKGQTRQSLGLEKKKYGVHKKLKQVQKEILKKYNTDISTVPWIELSERIQQDILGAL